MLKIFLASFFIFIICFQSSTHALQIKKGQSLKKAKVQSIKKSKKKSFIDSFKLTSRIRMALSLPLKNRNHVLSQYGASGFFILKHLAFSSKESTALRWKALSSLARLYPNKALPLVRKALKSNEWFLRNVGLIAMEAIRPKEAVIWAGRLLNDPSLIIRTAAVHTIQKYKAKQYKRALLAKLNSADSFHRKKSLWIRRHIVSALADFSEPGEEHFFISLLRDPDKRLHSPAISALEKLTGRKFNIAQKSSSNTASPQLF